MKIADFFKSRLAVVAILLLISSLYRLVYINNADQLTAADLEVLNYAQEKVIPFVEAVRSARIADALNILFSFFLFYLSRTNTLLKKG